MKFGLSGIKRTVRNRGVHIIFGVHKVRFDRTHVTLCAGHSEQQGNEHSQRQAASTASTSTEFRCPRCLRTCLSRIGLHRHQRTQKHSTLPRTHFTLYRGITDDDDITRGNCIQ